MPNIPLTDGFTPSSGLLPVTSWLSAVSERNGFFFMLATFHSPYLSSLRLGHDSTVTIMDTYSGTPVVLKLRELPLCDLVFVNENTVVGAGHNNFPRTFIKNGEDWSVGKNLDEQKAATAQKTTGTRAAFEKFKTTDTTGVATVQSKLNTKHQNYVNSIQGCAGSAGNFSKVSTTGLDGKLVLWDL